MSIARTAADKEEETELNYLRDVADRSGADAAQTLAELARRVSVARRPWAAARRMAADARVTALRALREGPGVIAGRRGAWRPALAAVPVLVLAAAFAYAAARGGLISGKPSLGGSYRGPARLNGHFRIPVSQARRGRRCRPPGPRDGMALAARARSRRPTPGPPPARS